MIGLRPDLDLDLGVDFERGTPITYQVIRLFLTDHDEQKQGFQYMKGSIIKFL